MDNYKVRRPVSVILLAVLLAFSPVAHAAIANTAQWDVRSTGADGNAGCFVPGLGGTDFSQQNAAQFSFADLASANGTSATPSVTSASHNFVAADVGNCMHISAGTNWTTGWYYCTAAAANACTMDRAVGSVAALTAGTWAEGGALATLAGTGTATAANGGNNGAGGGNSSQVIGTINVRSQTITLTATVTTINSSALWQCYNTSHGDNAGTCTITTATNSTDLIHLGAFGNGTSTLWDGFTFTNTAGTSAIGFQPTGANHFYAGFRNCSFSGFTIAIDGRSSIGTLWTLVDLQGVEVKNTTTIGVANDGEININASRIHGNVIGVQDNQLASVASGIFLSNSLVTNNTSNGLQTLSSFNCVNSTIANNTGDGVTIAYGAAAGGVFNSNSCVYWGNGGFGANYDRSDATGNPAPVPFISLARNNAYGSNTSGARQNLNAGLGDITLTTNPFVNSATENYAPNNLAGGGVLLRGLGFPGVFPGGLTTGFISIGGAQPNPAGASCTGACRIR